MPTKKKSVKKKPLHKRLYAQLGGMKLQGKVKMSRTAVLVAALVVVGMGAGVWKLSSHGSGYCVQNTFGVGNAGHCVKDIQVLLNEMTHMQHAYLGWAKPYPGTYISEDGIYGSGTKNQVVVYQKWYAYKAVAVDGIVGPNTWFALCQYAWQPGAYNDPSYNTSWNQAALAAGRDAGCTYAKQI